MAFCLLSELVLSATCLCITLALTDARLFGQASRRQASTVWVVGVAIDTPAVAVDQLRTGIGLVPTGGALRFRTVQKISFVGVGNCSGFPIAVILAKAHLGSSLPMSQPGALP